MPLKCAYCDQPLKAPLWKDQGEFFIPCFSCGVRNIVQPALQVIGWRRDATLLPRRSRRRSRAQSRLTR